MTAQRAGLDSISQRRYIIPVKWEAIVNKKGFIFVLFAVTPLLLVSCSKSPTAPNNTGNLITNPDFQLNGSPSLAGWAINDTAWVKVVSNAPPGVTTWSLWTAPAGGIIPGGVATTYVTGQSGQGIYRFSCAEVNMAHGYWGYATIAQLRSRTTISSRSISLEDSVWAMYTMSDTLDLLPSDTISITIATGSLFMWMHESSYPGVDSAKYGCCFNQVALVKAE